MSSKPCQATGRSPPSQKAPATPALTQEAPCCHRAPGKALNMCRVHLHHGKHQRATPGRGKHLSTMERPGHHCPGLGSALLPQHAPGSPTQRQEMHPHRDAHLAAPPKLMKCPTLWSDPERPALTWEVPCCCCTQARTACPREVLLCLRAIPLAPTANRKCCTSAKKISQHQYPLKSHHKKANAWKYT